MADDTVTLTSTTDSPEAVAAALGVSEDQVVVDAPPSDSDAAGAVLASSHNIQIRKLPDGGIEAVAGPPDPDADPVDENADARGPRRPGGGRLQRRIAELVKVKHESAAAQSVKDAEIAALRRRIDELAAAAPAPAVTAPPTAPPMAMPGASDPQPQPRDFQTYEDWSTANSRWAIRQEMRQQAAAHELQQAAAAFNQQQAAVRRNHPDFDEVVGSAADVPVTSEAAQRILQSPVGAQLQYAIAADRTLAEEFGRADAIGQVLILGRLEGALGLSGASRRAAPSRAPSRATRPVTKAPDPISPVTTTTSTTTVSPDRMSFQEYKRWRNSGGQ